MIFFFNFALKTYDTLKIKCPKQFLYHIEFISRRTCAKKFNSEFYVFGWFPSLQNLDIFFWKFFMELFWKSFSGRNSSLEFPGFFLFSSSFPYDLLALRVLRDWLDGFWGNRHSEMQKSFCWQSFCVFQSPLWIYELLWNAKSCFF